MPFKKNDPNINRKGRPKVGDSINDRIRKFFDETEEDEESSKKCKRIDLLIKELWKCGKKGDFQALRYLTDRLGGRPTEKVEVSGDEDRPIGIVFLPQRLTPDEWMNEQGNRESMDSTTETEDSA